MKFVKASKKESRARIALIGPAGSGKTRSALGIASGLGTRIAVIDTERGSASKYADLVDFDVLELESFAPAQYVAALQAAAGEHYDVVIVDSLSHAWMGKDGALEQVDRAAKRSSGNSFAAWRDVTPQHNQLVEALLTCPAHVIVTMRSKTEYVLEEDARGKKVPRKVGMAPIQRDGLEYEFDIVGELTVDTHDLCITKTRFEGFDGAVERKPGRKFGEAVAGWLHGVKSEPKAAAPTQRRSEPPPAEGPRFGGKWDKDWAGRLIETAPPDVIGKYVDDLDDVLRDPARSAAHAKVSAHKADVEAVYDALMEREMAAAEQRHKSTPPPAADDIADRLQQHLDDERSAKDGHEGWGLTP